MRDLRTTRKIDDVGRIVIPKSARTLLELSEGMEMQFFIDEEKKEIILRPVAQGDMSQDTAMQAFIDKFGADAVAEFVKKLEK